VDRADHLRARQCFRRQHHRRRRRSVVGLPHPPTLPLHHFIRVQLPRMHSHHPQPLAQRLQLCRHLPRFRRLRRRLRLGLAEEPRSVALPLWPYTPIALATPTTPHHKHAYARGHTHPPVAGASAAGYINVRLAACARDRSVVRGSAAGAAADGSGVGRGAFARLSRERAKTTQCIAKMLKRMANW
jgi:hypothetical protein